MNTAQKLKSLHVKGSYSLVTSLAEMNSKFKLEHHDLSTQEVRRAFVFEDGSSVIIRPFPAKIEFADTPDEIPDELYSDFFRTVSFLMMANKGDPEMPINSAGREFSAIEKIEFVSCLHDWAKLRR